MITICICTILWYLCTYLVYLCTNIKGFKKWFFNASNPFCIWLECTQRFGFYVNLIFNINFFSFFPLLFLFFCAFFFLWCWLYLNFWIWLEWTLRWDFEFLFLFFKLICCVFITFLFVFYLYFNFMYYCCRWVVHPRLEISIWLD